MRYFIGRDAGSVIREKQVFAGDESKADGLVSSFLVVHPGWTAQEVDQATFDASIIPVDNVPLRASAIDSFLNDPTAFGKVDRAEALVELDEINLVRQWLVAFKAAVALATSFANLQARIAALPDMPDRVISQIKSALQSKINAGTAD